MEESRWDPEVGCLSKHLGVMTLPKAPCLGLLALSTKSTISWGTFISPESWKSETQVCQGTSFRDLSLAVDGGFIPQTKFSCGLMCPPYVLDYGHTVTHIMTFSVNKVTVKDTKGRTPTQKGFLLLLFAGGDTVQPVILLLIEGVPHLILMVTAPASRDRMSV